MKPLFVGLLLFLLSFPVLGEQENQSFDELFEEEILEEEDGSAGGNEPAGDAGGGKLADDAGGDEQLFEEEIIEEEGEGQEAAPEEAFLVSERVEWGGYFELYSEAQTAWEGYPDSFESLLSGGSSSFSSEVAADLFFDARPQRDFRVFGKLKAAYGYQFESGSYEWDAEIFELFSDFQYKDLLFFRAGKQTVAWGVGYFFSPADVLSLVSIDPEDPEAEREGPVALKTHFPFAVHNAYLYLVANDIDEPSEIAAAPKVEVLLGNYELGIGAFYQRDLAPKGMLTLSGPLWRLDLFGEALAQWGSDDAPVEDELLFSGTAGFAYVNPDWDIILVAQYLFDDRRDMDQHYLAAGLRWFDLLGSRFSSSVLYQANFSDGSGVIQPDITWAPIDELRVTLRWEIGYGSGGALAWSLIVSAGGPF
jgi:hypothetical protein